MASKKAYPAVIGDKYPGPAESSQDGFEYPRVNKSFDQLARGGAAMKHDEKEDREERAAGGRTSKAHASKGAIHTDSGSDNSEDGEGSGNPTFSPSPENYVSKEAHGDVPNKAHGGSVHEDEEEREEDHRGGSVHKKHRKKHRDGHKVEGEASHFHMGRGHHKGRSTGGQVARATGGRVARAKGGGVGADRNPLTQAARLSPPKGEKRTPEDNTSGV